MEERKKGFIESMHDGYMKLIAFGLVLSFFVWLGGCIGCSGCHKKTKNEERIEKSVKILNNKIGTSWDKWIQENDSIKQ